MRFGALLLSALLCALADAEPVRVAAIYYPHWHPYPVGEKLIFGSGKSEWELVKGQKPRYEGHSVPVRPLMGFYDETDPKMVEKEIDLAADAGIDVFLYDWYFYGDRPMMEEALNRGYLKARNNDRVRFALLWCYHDRRNRFCARPEDPGVWVAKRERTPDEFRRNFDWVLERYLVSPHYWRKDGKPFFSIFNAEQFVGDMGGPEKTRALLGEANAKAVGKGVGPIHWNAMQGTNFAAYARAGFDSCAAYNFTFNVLQDHKRRFDAKEQLAEYTELADTHRRFWKERENLDGITFLPTVTRGWDCSARCHPDEPFPWRVGGYPYSGIVRNNTPELFRQLLADARDFAETSPKKPGVVIINAWNEYTEGSWLVPDEGIGDASLRAVRTVFRPE